MSGSYQENFQIRNATFRDNLIFGPLAGYTCAPMRLITEQYGQPAYCTTEMISAKHLIHHTDQMHRYLYKGPKEGKVAFQLSGNNPEDLRRAVNIVAKHGADLIDLNCGCPQPKIRKKNTGTKLLEDAKHLQEIISAMRQETDLPLTVKIRVDRGYTDYNKSVLDAVVLGGADAVIVHGRNWRDDYQQSVSLEEIRFFKERAPIPVIANGDVSSPEHAIALLRDTGCDGIMISRAVTGNPWLFQQIRQHVKKKALTIPDKEAIQSCFDAHVSGLCQLLGKKKGLLESRKLHKYYFPHKTPVFKDDS